MRESAKAPPIMSDVGARTTIHSKNPRNYLPAVNRAPVYIELLFTKKKKKSKIKNIGSLIKQNKFNSRNNYIT